MAIFLLFCQTLCDLSRYYHGDGSTNSSRRRCKYRRLYYLSVSNFFTRKNETAAPRLWMQWLFFCFGIGNVGTPSEIPTRMPFQCSRWCFDTFSLNCTRCFCLIQTWLRQQTLTQLMTLGKCTKKWRPSVFRRKDLKHWTRWRTE